MSLRSIFSALRDKWPGRVASRRRPLQPLRRRPMLEALEERVVPTVPPTILAVTPLDFSTSGTATANPPISITFSEAMDATDVTNANNYALFNSEGQSITLQLQPTDYNAANNTLTIPPAEYNGGVSLPADTYTLFIRGDRVREFTDQFAISLPNQLVVANTSTGTVSTLNAGVPLPVTNTTPYFYQSVQSYPVYAANGFPTPTPVAILTADFNGDGNLDVAVVNKTTDEVDVYAGQANGVYSSTPRSALPAGSIPVDAIVAPWPTTAG